MQFRPPPPPQVKAVSAAHRPTTSDRGCPLDTAGDRCLWHAGGTAGQNDAFPAGGDGSQLDRRARPVLSDPSPRGQEPGGLAAVRWGDSNSTSPISSARGQRALGRAACRFDECSVTALVHRCPWFANRLRTQHGPSGVPVPVRSRTPSALSSRRLARVRSVSLTASDGRQSQSQVYGSHERGI